MNNHVASVHERKKPFKCDKLIIAVLMKNSETTIPESMDSLITDSWKLVHLTLGSFLCHCIGTLADSWNYGVLKLPFLKSTGLLKLRIRETTIP